MYSEYLRFKATGKDAEYELACGLIAGIKGGSRVSSCLNFAHRIIDEIIPQYCTRIKRVVIVQIS